MSIGENIINNLEASGFSLKDIAQKAGIPYISLLQMKKSGKFNSPVIDKLSSALEISPLHLISSAEERLQFFLSKSQELKNQFPGFVDQVFSNLNSDANNKI
jgi:transcriptional regulator with XRE-family HTH domain